MGNTARAGPANPVVCSRAFLGSLAQNSIKTAIGLRYIFIGRNPQPRCFGRAMRHPDVAVPPGRAGADISRKITNIENAVPASRADIQDRRRGNIGPPCILDTHHGAEMTAQIARPALSWMPPNLLIFSATASRQPCSYAAAGWLYHDRFHQFSWPALLPV